MIVIGQKFTVIGGKKIYQRKTFLAVHALYQAIQRHNWLTVD